MINIQLGGNNWKAGKLIHEFRTNLMKQHLGDPLLTAGNIIFFLYYNINFLF